MRTRSALLAYFALVFGISWTAAAVVAGRGQTSLLFVAMLLGPALASIGLTVALDGVHGLRELGRGLLRWRIGARWYGALLIAPALIAMILGLLSRGSPSFRPDLVSGASIGGVLAYAGIAGFGAGICEELGWTGFATPRLLERHSWFRAGLLLGLVWAAWHVLPDYLGRTEHGPLWVVHVLEWFVALTAFRVVMTWIYRHTRSLALGMLMHASFTGAQALLWTTRASLAEELIWYGAFAIALWIVVGLVVNRGAIRAFIREHPAASYFALTFAISWGGMVLIVGPTGIVGTKQEFERMFPIALSMLVLGPTVAGILLTGLVGGRPALRELRSRLLRWRVGGRWYAVAILTAPLYFLMTGLALAAFRPDFLPAIFTVDDKALLVLRGLAVALTAGIVEELGWTGFAIPTLRRRHGALATGLIVGTLWGLWHVLPKIWGAAAHGLVDYLPVDLLSAIVGLTGFRILMVWVYDRTHSLLLAILMHMGLTASTLILQPAITGAPLLAIGLVLTAVPWGIVAAVAIVRYQRSHRGRGSGTRPEAPWSPTATPRPVH